MVNGMIPAVLSEKIFFPIYEKVSGRILGKKIDQFEQSQWLDRNGIQALQDKKLLRLLMHAQKNVPFYRELLGPMGNLEKMLDYEHFRTIPILGKKDVGQNFFRLIAENVPLHSQRLNVTSGSTSTPMKFYSDMESLDYKSAITLRGDKWAGRKIGTKHVRLWGAFQDIRREKEAWNSLKSLMLNRIWLNSFDVSDSVLERYVKIIRRSKPAVIVGYATALEAMANYLTKNGIGGLNIQSIISSAEMLLPQQRTLIEKAFQCKVYDRYGNREVGPIAVECEAGGMHVNADFVKVELLRDNQPALPGQIGEIVITALNCYGMPLIRYNTSDLAIAAPNQDCPCGRQLPVIQNIVGRKHDILTGLNGSSMHGAFFAKLFYYIEGIKQFQVVQYRLEELEISYVPAKGFKKTALDGPAKKIRQAMGGVRILWHETSRIEPTVSGKHRYTISRLGN